MLNFYAVKQQQKDTPTLAIQSPTIYIYSSYPITNNIHLLQLSNHQQDTHTLAVQSPTRYTSLASQSPTRYTYSSCPITNKIHLLQQPNHTPDTSKLAFQSPTRYTYFNSPITNKITYSSCPITSKLHRHQLPNHQQHILTLAVQSPTLKKFFGKNGFLCNAQTGPWWPGYTDTIFSPGVLAFLLQVNIDPCSVPTINFVGYKHKVTVSNRNSNVDTNLLSFNKNRF